MKPVYFHPEAEAEFRAAIGYYEGQREGLGGEYRAEIEAAVRRIQQTPTAFAQYDDRGTRRCLVRRFPYTIYFAEYLGRRRGSSKTPSGLLGRPLARRWLMVVSGAGLRPRRSADRRSPLLAAAARRTRDLRSGRGGGRRPAPNRVAPPSPPTLQNQLLPCSAWVSVPAVPPTAGLLF